jgi:hypothetical protein
MSEHAPKAEGEQGDSFPMERLQEAVREYDKSPEAAKVLNGWRIRELDKRVKATTAEEKIRIHFNTAYTLRDLGLINDAREMLEDIANIAEGWGDEDSLSEAVDAMEQLPTIH